MDAVCRLVSSARLDFSIDTSGLGRGRAIGLSQIKKCVQGELIEETLEMFEQNGGEDAFINIKCAP
eukprot:5612411-Amphidinium_carterae.1